MSEQTNNNNNNNSLQSNYTYKNAGRRSVYSLRKIGFFIDKLTKKNKLSKHSYSS